MLEKLLKVTLLKNQSEHRNSQFYVFAFSELNDAGGKIIISLIAAQSLQSIYWIDYFTIIDYKNNPRSFLALKFDTILRLHLAEIQSILGCYFQQNVYK